MPSPLRAKLLTIVLLTSNARYDILDLCQVVFIFNNWRPLCVSYSLQNLYVVPHWSNGATLMHYLQLTYTRGSVIPLCLRLEGTDSQVLDMLSNPKAIVTRMRRRIKYHHNAEKTIESFAWKDAIDHSQLALWWPSSEGSEDRHGRVRYVNGELHLRGDVKATAAMASFRIEVRRDPLPCRSSCIVIDAFSCLRADVCSIRSSYFHSTLWGLISLRARRTSSSSPWISLLPMHQVLAHGCLPRQDMKRTSRSSK
jgi:hypothetical protein